MDNAQKAIMIGVGLFITIIIISAVLLVVNLGTGMMDDATSELGNISDSLQQQLVRSYDGKTIKGSELLDCVERYAGSDTMALAVKVDTTTQNYTKVTATLPSGITSDDYKIGGIVATKTAKSTSVKTYAEALNFISSSDMFKTTLVYNKAGRLVGIAAIKI